MPDDQTLTVTVTYQQFTYHDEVHPEDPKAAADTARAIAQVAFKRLADLAARRA